jgi:hypothetical protein
MSSVYQQDTLEDKGEKGLASRVELFAEVSIV